LSPKNQLFFWLDFGWFAFLLHPW